MDFNFSSEFIRLIFDNKPFFNQKDLTCLEAYFRGGLERFKISAEIDEFVVEELGPGIDPIEYIPKEFKELYREEKLKINLPKSPQEQLEAAAFKAQQYRAKLKQTVRNNKAIEDLLSFPPQKQIQLLLNIWHFKTCYLLALQYTKECNPAETKFLTWMQKTFSITQQEIPFVKAIDELLSISDAQDVDKFRTTQEEGKKTYFYILDGYLTQTKLPLSKGFLELLSSQACSVTQEDLNLSFTFLSKKTQPFNATTDIDGFVIQETEDPSDIPNPMNYLSPAAKVTLGAKLCLAQKLLPKVTSAKKPQTEEEETDTSTTSSGSRPSSS